MKKIIQGKTYNTDTSSKIAERGTGRTADFSDWFEELHVTKKGNFFVYYWGGANTQFAETFNNGRSRNEGSGIRTIDKDDALSFLDDCFFVDEELVEKHFDIEEA